MVVKLVVNLLYAPECIFPSHILSKDKLLVFVFVFVFWPLLEWPLLEKCPDFLFVESFIVLVE